MRGSGFKVNVKSKHLIRSNLPWKSLRKGQYEDEFSLSSTWPGFLRCWKRSVYHYVLYLYEALHSTVF